MQGFSQAADNNKAPILTVLSEWLQDHARVLEVGSGAGQHAIHFAGTLESIRWQPTERAEVLPTLVENIAAYGSANILPPIPLDLSANHWPQDTVDCVYAANVMHIVSQSLGANLVRGAAEMLAKGGVLLLYGPFKYRGDFTTPSNADFDQWLKARDQSSGIRDIEWLCDLATESRLSLVEDRPMPANNQMLVLRR
jgi:cyclopropane fatty-acyl-phospholipid synthase-like methyltransferase